MFDHSVTLLDAAMDRSDVELHVQIGPKKVGTYAGPWMRGHMYELWRIWGDAWIEGRKEDADKIKEEWKGMMTSGLTMPIIVPCRMPLELSVRPVGKSLGWVTVNLRSILTVDVQ